MMMNWCKGFAPGFLFLTIWMVSACSTQAVKTGRHGVLEDQDSSYRPSRKIASFPESDSEVVPHLSSGGQVHLSGQWQWPLDEIEISSSYGERHQKFHQGVDLRAKVGTPVHAAADGKVVYVGSKIRGYGRMIVLKHEGGFYSVYAHHSKNSVKIGQRVDRGQVIALSGKSGRSRGAHLHFELRRGTQSYDPEYALNLNLKTSVNRKVASKSRFSDTVEE